MKSLFIKYKIELAVFITIIMTMLSNIALSIPHWNFLTFVIDYNTGFGGRKLIGTVVSTILGGFVSIKSVIILMLSFIIIIVSVLSLLIGAFIKRLKSYGHGHYLFSIYTFALYLFCPASLLFLVNSSNMGRMDGFIIILLFLFIPFYVRNKYKYSLVLLLSILSMLIHPIFACTYFAFYMAIMIYDSWSAGVDKRKVFVSLSICVILFVFFYFIQLAPKNVVNVDEAFAYLQSRTDYPLNKSSLYYEYYAPMNIHLQDWAIPNYLHSIVGLVLCLIFLSPVFLFFYVFWKGCIKESESKERKRVFIMMNASFLIMIPAFVVTVDYARWMASYIICQFALIGILTYLGDKFALNSSLNIYRRIRKYPVAAILILLYLSSFPKFTDMVYPGFIENIIGFMGIPYISFF